MTSNSSGTRAGTAREIQITLDCADPAALAAFWAEALGYKLQDPPGDFRTWDEALDAMGVPPERRNDASAVVDPAGDATPGPPEREPARAYGVTMVRPGVVPSFEVGAYEYFGRGLPLVGEIIVIHRIEGPDAGEVTQGYVTRLNLDSNPPIAVTEVANTFHNDRAS